MTVLSFCPCGGSVEADACIAEWEHTGNYAVENGVFWHWDCLTEAKADFVKKQYPPGKDGPCPACGADSRYVRADDLLYHRDGSANRACWLRIIRGEAR